MQSCCGFANTSSLIMLISFTIEAVVWVALIEFIGCFTTKFQV